MLFDTHAHILDPRFDEDREELIGMMPANGVAGFVECGTDLETSLRAAELAQKHAHVYAAVGVHPHDASEWNESYADQLLKLIAENKAVAVGEIGLDYHYDLSDRDVQRKVFRTQMELALSAGAPVVIHSREATQDTLDILRDYPDVTGIMHCFSGSIDTLKTVLDLGYWVAFGGAVTFKNAKKPLEALRYTPDDRLLLETDSPYMTPVPLRGKRNAPQNVALIAEKAAEVRGTSVDSIGELTARNAEQAFRISIA